MTITSPPPFQVLARRSVATNTRFNLRFDHLRTEEGDDIPTYLVVDPLVRSTCGYSGVAVLPVVDGHFLLQRIYRHPVERWGWEVPRGFIDAGETPVEAAQRELVEETGLACPLDAIQPLGEVSPEPGVFSSHILMFAATGCHSDPDRRLPELGRGESRLFAAEEVLAMAGTPVLFCATTMVCFFRYYSR